VATSSTSPSSAAASARIFFVRREAGDREDGGVHGQAGGLRREEAGREDHVQGSSAAAAQGPGVSETG
jgi:hypothetical protein